MKCIFSMCLTILSTKFEYSGGYLLTMVMSQWLHVDVFPGNKDLCKHDNSTRLFQFFLDGVSFFWSAWFVGKENLSSPHLSSHSACTVLATKSELRKVIKPRSTHNTIKSFHVYFNWKMPNHVVLPKSMRRSQTLAGRSRADTWPCF